MCMCHWSQDFDLLFSLSSSPSSLLLRMVFGPRLYFSDWRLKSSGNLMPRHRNVEGRKRKSTFCMYVLYPLSFIDCLNVLGNRCAICILNHIVKIFSFFCWEAHVDLSCVWFVDSLTGRKWPLFYILSIKPSAVTSCWQ